MNILDYVFDSVLVLLVVLQIKEQPLTRGGLIRPLVVVGISVSVYLRQIPTGGNDLLLTVSLAALGAAIGWASGITVHMRPGSNGQTLVQARWASAFFWVLGMGGRFAFLVWITYGGKTWLTQFSIHHDITSSAVWTVAVLSQAVFEVVARTVVLGTRSARIVSRMNSQQVALKD